MASSIYNALFTGSEAVTLAAGTTIGGKTTDSANRLVDVTTATLSVTKALHDGKTLLMDKTGGTAFTLPAATGTGMQVTFMVAKVDTTGYTIATLPTTDIFKGGYTVGIADGSVTSVFGTSTNSNLLTLNGTTKGGASIGDYITIEDIAAGVWSLRGTTVGTATIATGLSHV